MPLCHDELSRLRTLSAFIGPTLDDDPRLNRITRFAADLCEAPICVVSLVEAERQRFVARTGLAARETPRSVSFCAHAMLESGLMVVPDASADPRFAANDLVTGEPGIRFYAGAPLVSEDGAPLGALAVISPEPREGLTSLQAAGLGLLAEQVVAYLDSGRQNRAREESEAVAERAVSESDQRFRILADTMPQMVWSTLPDGYHDYYNARWYEFTGMPPGSTDGEAWNGMFHPDDQEQAWKRWRHSLETGEPYEIEYRLRNAAGGYRWTLGRALPIRDSAGEITRWFGTCTEIHEQKLLAEQQAMLSNELSHRIKNIFTMVAGMITLSGRRSAAWLAPAKDLRERVIALGRAHDFVRPREAGGGFEPGQSRNLHGLLASIFAPYQIDAARIVVAGADPAIDERSATPLALIFHELATNAAKYGALSNEDGRVTLDVAAGQSTVILTWGEHGGPRIAGEPAGSGFGTQLLDLSAVGQLGAELTRRWRPEGLQVELNIPTAALVGVL